MHQKRWLRLIRKIYEVDPLICPKCQGVMRISSSDDLSVIFAILIHLGLWREVKTLILISNRMMLNAYIGNYLGNLGVTCNLGIYVCMEGIAMKPW